MGTIFISYRRKDASGHTGRLYDTLLHEFGKGNVFFDVASIEPGADFKRKIEVEIAASQVVIVIIARDWLRISDEDGRRRLDNIDDMVRFEIKTALSLGKHIIPLLVNGATMPSKAQLPDDIGELAARNAIEIRDASFHQDAEQLKQNVKALSLPAGKSISTASKITLYKVEGGKEVLLFVTDQRLITIGRSPHNMLCVSDNRVSWEHGQIIFRDNTYFYCHLSNSCTTIIRRPDEEYLCRAGKRDEHRLRDRDHILIGSDEFLIACEIMSENRGYVPTSRESQDEQ